MIGNELEMIGLEIGKYPDFYEAFSGEICSFHEVKKAGNARVIAKKCMKKDLM